MGALRETLEEVGVTVSAENANLKHKLSHEDPNGSDKVDFF